MKPIFRMPPKKNLQRGLYSIALNMLISSWLFHLTLKRTDVLYIWHLQHKACWACYVKYVRLAVMLNDLEILLKLTLKWEYSIPFRNKWHDSMGATSPQVQLDLLSRMSGLCDWTWQLVWVSNGYTILEGFTSYPGLCNKQVPSPYHAYKYIIQRWERFKFNL